MANVELDTIAPRKWEANFSGAAPTLDVTGDVHVGDIAVDTSTSPNKVWRAFDVTEGAPVWSVHRAGGELAWSSITTNTNAEKGRGYILNGSSASVTLTLPSSPSDGDAVGWKALDITNALTIARNGENIEGSASDLNLDVENAGGILVYTNQGTTGWTNVTEINGGGSTGSINNETIWALHA